MDLNRYTYDENRRNTIRNQLKLSGKFAVGDVGRVAYQKNFSFLVDCFCEVQKRDDRADLLLVGDGYLEKELRYRLWD